MSRRNKRRAYSGLNRQDMMAKEKERIARDANKGFIDNYYEDDDNNDDEEEIVEDPNPTIVLEKTLNNHHGHKSFKEPESESRPIYVVDTNLILSCVDVLYDPNDEDWHKPLDFEPCLDHAHIVIPYVVFEELEHIKNESSLRGMAARTAIRRLENFFPNSERRICNIMNLSEPVPTGYKDQVISILPVHKHFMKSLPFLPREDDNDGKVAITALAATMVAEDLIADGIGEHELIRRSNVGKKVILLTNDRGLRCKADLLAVRTERYSFTKRKRFSGRRDLVVPKEMFEKFYHEDKLSEKDFKRYLPDELPLIENEYVVMTPEGDDYPRGYFSDGILFKNVARFNGRHGYLYPLRFMKYEGRDAPNAGIATYYDALNDDSIKVINVTGKAGTGKTFQAIMYAIRSAQSGKYAHIVLIPSRSAKNPLGALPGNQEKKMEPLVATAKDAIRSYLASLPEFQRKREELRRYGDKNHNSNEEKCESKKKKRKEQQRTYREPYQYDYDDDDGYYTANDFSEPHSKKKDKVFYPSKSDKDSPDEKISYNDLLEKQTNYLFYRYFTCIPYEEAEGRSFEDAVVIYDEAQRILVDTADTLFSRPASGSKMIVCGDINQVYDSTPEKRFQNGLNYSRMAFTDWEGCANIHLTDNMRSDIARVITNNRDRVRWLMGLY